MPILQTGLDADDGLHREFVGRVQAVALRRFAAVGSGTNNGVKQHQPPPPPRWLYWCVGAHLEWHSHKDGGHNDRPPYGSVPEFGYVKVAHQKGYCITPGLTVGFNVGTNDEDVPRVPHHMLHKFLRNKSKPCRARSESNSNNKKPLPRERSGGGPCLTILGDDYNVRKIRNFTFYAIRSRTLTSAGMGGVMTGGYGEGNINGGANAVNGTAIMKRTERAIWNVIENEFGIHRVEPYRTRAYVQGNYKSIARDNMAGQCTKDHSCKDAAKKRLSSILEN